MVDDPGPPADQAEAEEHAYLEQQIARIRAIEEPTAKQLSAMREAMRALEDVKRRQARRVAREWLSRPPSKPKPKCRRLADEYEWPEGLALCDCAEPCILARLHPNYRDGIQETIDQVWSAAQA